MPTPKKPIAAVIESGTLGKNPGRYKNRIAATTAPVIPPGHPPRYLSRLERDIWNEIVRGATPGLLSRSDRRAIEVIVRLVAKMRTTELKHSEVNLIMATLSKLGLTPQDRARMDVPVPEPGPSQAVVDTLSELD